jgi:hypothetical protein
MGLSRASAPRNPISNAFVNAVHIVSLTPLVQSSTLFRHTNLCKIHSIRQLTIPQWRGNIFSCYMSPLMEIYRYRCAKYCCPVFA